MIKLIINHDYAFDASNIISLFFGKTQINVIALEDSQSYFHHEENFISSTIEETDAKITAAAVIQINGKLQRCIESSKDLDKKSIKAAVKLSLYKLLSQVYSKSYPWGILTGIRPLKLVHQMMDKGSSSDVIQRYMEKEYLVSKEKARLAVEIANVEREFIASVNPKSVSIYIGIPFCPTRCHYCSFTSNSLKAAGKLVEKYLDALIYEMEQTAARMNKYGLVVETIYIGGGTPTSLNELQLDRLLQRVVELFGSRIIEFTCEAGRPDTITEGKLQVMKQNGITRISINPQTMNDSTLQKIGRDHTVQQTIESFQLARKLGFDNINMDIILGLPDEGLPELEITLKEIGRLKPDSLTIHTLAIKRASVINEKLEEYESQFLTTSSMMKAALEFTAKEGMHPYYLYRQKHMVENLENIGCSKAGKECIYNIQIIEERQSNIAFGADAITKTVNTDSWLIKRQGNIKDIRLYIENIDAQIDKKLTLLEELYGDL